MMIEVVVEEAKSTARSLRCVDNVPMSILLEGVDDNWMGGTAI